MLTTVSIYLSVTFLAALLAVLIRLPPLVGFLAAGFALNLLGVGELPGLETFADLGVTLLLFGIGLKLDARTLLRREVWLTSAVHLAATILVATAFLTMISMVGSGLVARSGWTGLLLVGFALSFSSTVFVVKILSARSESQSHYGRVAIGVLIMQDIAAVVFLTGAAGAPLSPWTLLLLLVLPGAWVLRRLWDLVPHGEMQALFGIVVALVPGYAAFELVGLKGDLGALVLGALLAGHPAAGELSKSLFTLKELLLVGFFVSIGLGELPTAEGLVLAGLLMLLVPLKAAGFFVLLWWSRLSHRSSRLTSLALANYSEFGLIVAAVGVEAAMLEEQWLTVLSVAVAASFVLSSLLNRSDSRAMSELTARLPEQDPDRLHPEDRPIDLSHGDAVVLGMGRIGRSAYLQLEREYDLEVIGIETDLTRIEQLRAEGLEVQEADATDSAFWDRVSHTGEVRLVVLAMPFHGSNVLALQKLRESGFTGTVAAVSQWDDEAREMRTRGAHSVLQLYSGAGTQLADEAVEVIRER